MPIPKRKLGESKKAFVSRCMANETMRKDYTDIKQRSAICYSQADKKGVKAEGMDVSTNEETVESEE